jgi:hypothetical protein
MASKAPQWEPCLRTKRGEGVQLVDDQQPARSFGCVLLVRQHVCPAAVAAASPVDGAVKDRLALFRADRLRKQVRDPILCIGLPCLPIQTADGRFVVRPLRDARCSLLLSAAPHMKRAEWLMTHSPTNELILSHKLVPQGGECAKPCQHVCMCM